MSIYGSDEEQWAQSAWIARGGTARENWDALEMPWTFEEVLDYFKVMETNPSHSRGTYAGAALGFLLVCLRHKELEVDKIVREKFRQVESKKESPFSDGPYGA